MSGLDKNKYGAVGAEPKSKTPTPAPSTATVSGAFTWLTSKLTPVSTAKKDALSSKSASGSSYGSTGPTR